MAQPKQVDKTNTFDSYLLMYCILHQNSDTLCDTEEYRVVNLYTPIYKEILKVN